MRARDLADGVILAGAVLCVVVGVLLITSLWLGTPDPHELGLVP